MRGIARDNVAGTRFGDGTSQPVAPSVFPTSVPVNTLFITRGA
jgi:hypothetical protein